MKAGILLRFSKKKIGENLHDKWKKIFFLLKKGGAMNIATKLKKNIEKDCRIHYNEVVQKIQCNDDRVLIKTDKSFYK